MLTELRIQNFKTWADTGQLRLAPITIFFGGNSSGKSSLGQFLFMLRRTVEQSDRNLVLHTTDDQSPVDLGGYSDYIHTHEVSRDLSFKLEWRCAQPVRLADPTRKSGKPVTGTCMAFHSTVGAEHGSHERVVAKSLKYCLEPAGDEDALRVKMTRMANANYRLETYNFDAKRRKGRGWPLPAPSRFYGFPDELYAYYQNVADFANLQLELERAIRQVYYLGPLRQYPRRAYSWTGQTPSDVGYQGENTVPALLAGVSRKINSGRNARYRPLPEVIGEWLKRLGIVEDFRVRQVSKQTRAYQALLKMPGRPEEVTLSDVGFGVSQVLPVVTQAFYAPPHATVIIEQPELHLHPAVQSEMADLFVAAIHSKEDGAERGVQFLIESHSEHFLRRLQRRVAEGTLAPEEIAIYVCSREGKESTISSLGVNQYGGITSWPRNFFGDSMTDIAEMRKAALQRQIAAEEGSGLISR